MQASMKHRASTAGELHARLKMKLAELRGENFGKGKKSKKGKKVKLTKAEKKQKAKEEKQIRAKLAKFERQSTSDKGGPGRPANPPVKIFNSEGKMVFSKFDFANGESAPVEGVKKTKLDPKSALKRIQNEKEKLQSLKSIGKGVIPGDHDHGDDDHVDFCLF